MWVCMCGTLWLMTLFWARKIPSAPMALVTAMAIRLDATYIEVSVAEGDVTLAGLVVSREDKRRAERLAEEVSGVGDVQNNLRLRRQDGGEAGEVPPNATF